MLLWQTAKWLTLAAEGIVAAPVAYLSAVSLSALWQSRKLRGAATPATPAPGEEPRFAIIIPAHNEERVITTLLESLHTLAYPCDRRDIYVIADNCEDDTAGVVTRSGIAQALTRTDIEHRGKGYALAWAFERLANHAPPYDAYVVIDADSVVDPSLLSAYARALAAGATAAQASNTVLNTLDSPATVLRWLALTLMNHVRPLGRNGLGASSTLTGNGMCLSRELLARQPWRAFGLTEDYQYYLTIVTAGERVRYVPDAIVRSVMPTSFDDMRSQDLRWESGGDGIATRTWAAQLLRRGVRKRDWVRIDAALELIAPPLSQLAAGLALVVALTLLIRDPWTVGLAAALTAGTLLYIGSAFLILRPPLAAYRALLLAPKFLAWKLWVTLVLRRAHSRSGAWVRTNRAQAPTSH